MKKKCTNKIKKLSLSKNSDFLILFNLTFQLRLFGVRLDPQCNFPSHNFPETSSPTAISPTTNFPNNNFPNY